MVRLAKMAVAGALAASVAAGVTTPAEARVSTGLAVGAGLLGLGVGAAVASDHRHYYDGGYYAPPPPPPPPAPVAYYAPPPPQPYYAPPPPPAYGYEYVQRCRVVDRWNPYYGRYIQSRRCW